MKKIGKIPFFHNGSPSVTHTEKLISVIGGFVGILLVFLVSSHFLGGPAAQWVVASMGASAVLLFAVPHGALSQPWPVLGGHLVSAIVGVTCAGLIHEPMLAAALAVSISIGAMYYLGCIHPPGGATALTAVVGGPVIHELGYWFVVTPVLVNVVVILLTAFFVNYMFAWRRYPAWLNYIHAQPDSTAEGDSREGRQPELSQIDLQYALRRLGSYVDVTEQDLERIFELASYHAREGNVGPSEIKQGHYYCNGAFGDDWQVRQVSEVLESSRVRYQVIAGKKRRREGDVSLKAFQQWARYEVVRRESLWIPVEAMPSRESGEEVTSRLGLVESGG